MYVNGFSTKERKSLILGDVGSPPQKARTCLMLILCLLTDSGLRLRSTLQNFSNSPSCTVPPEPAVPYRFALV